MEEGVQFAAAAWLLAAHFLCCSDPGRPARRFASRIHICHPRNRVWARVRATVRRLIWVGDGIHEKWNVPDINCRYDAIGKSRCILRYEHFIRPETLEALNHTVPNPR